MNIKFMKLCLNYQEHFNTKLNYIINIFNEGIQKLDIEEINFDSYLTNYEKYINKNLVNPKEKKKKELNESIYNLFNSNYKLNEYYIKLMREINLDNHNYEKINEIIEYILEKKKLSITLLEQLNTKINIENENKPNDNTNKNNENMNAIERSINNFIKKENNEISLSDIQLNNYSFNVHDKTENMNAYNVYNNNNKTKIKSNFDIINEQKKIEILKSDFIEELNKYCKSKQNLNNPESVVDNKEKKENKDEDKNDKENKMKMDFAKSLTMCLKNNKNFKFNLNEENNKDN